MLLLFVLFSLLSHLPSASIGRLYQFRAKTRKAQTQLTGGGGWSQIRRQYKRVEASVLAREGEDMLNEKGAVILTHYGDDEGRRPRSIFIYCT
jgi:hypothetical protein